MCSLYEVIGIGENDGEIMGCYTLKELTEKIIREYYIDDVPYRLISQNIARASLRHSVLFKKFRVERIDMSVDLVPMTLPDYIEWCKFEKVSPWLKTSLLAYCVSVITYGG